MNIKKQIAAGLCGEQSIPRNLIFRAGKEGSGAIIEKFEALVKAGSHTKMYVGRPADWTYIPRSAAGGHAVGLSAKTINPIETI